MLSDDDKSNFERELLKAISHLRDVSLRDGVQSWDGNKWPIDKIVGVAKEENTFAQMVAEQGGRVPPIEVWGGGQVAQPAKFLKEDPFLNLQRIHEAAPELVLQCLYRGRQAFGFKPVSVKIQESALNSAAKYGVRVFRIFDMMNDIENVKPGIEILRSMKEQYDGIVIEGAISYISEPEGKKRAWELSEYGDYAVKLAKAGCNEIAIKNYAGVGDNEMPDLIKAVRAKLDESGFTTTKINLHTHGHKPQLLADSVKAGADKVDVAFSALSGGPSHSNYMDTLKALLKLRGMDVSKGGDYHDVFENNAIIGQLRTIEELVTFNAKSFDKRAKPLTQKEMDKYRMAGGALSDLWANYIKDDQFEPNKKMWQQKRYATSRQKSHDIPSSLDVQKTREAADVFGNLPAIPDDKLQWYHQVLELGAQLWEKAGRFNTVTPGALILTKQAVLIHNKRLSGEPITMEDYTPEYLDVITGRYGNNQGIEKGVGDIKFRDAALMFRTLKLVNTLVKDNEVEAAAVLSFLNHFAGIKQGDKATKNILIIDGKANLAYPRLEILLKNLDINEVRDWAEQLPTSIQAKVLKELTPGRSPEPTADLSEGNNILQAVKEKFDWSAFRNEHPHALSSDEDLALLAMLLRNTKPNGTPDDSIFSGLVGSVAKEYLSHSGQHLSNLEAKAARSSPARG